VDVRGNPGGLKEQAVAVTGEFLPPGSVVFIQVDAQGNREKVLAKGQGVATDFPIVVLIDEGTASSAEIFAGAMKDHKRAKLVGARTFGTGTVLEPFKLSDGSAVLLAVAKWLTPDGHEIWHQGTPPTTKWSCRAARTSSCRGRRRRSRPRRSRRSTTSSCSRQSRC
jgi:carboxyl-terminal processing protease